MIALSLCASSACGPGGERTDSSPNDSDAIADRAQPATDVASSDGATNAPMDGSMPTLDAGEDAALDVALEGAYDAANDGSADSATPARDTVELIAGSTATGFADGVGAAARFSGPSGAVLSADGATMYVADTFNALLRTIDVATGATRTVAGRLQVQSVVDGVGAAARFQSPRAMAITNDGATLYVADGPTVRRVDTRSWSVTTIAGTAGMSGYVDGAGATVRLGFLLHSFALSDDERTLYIADRSNRVLRALDVSAAPMTGEVRTVAGTRYTGADVHADGVGAAARFSGLGGILRVGGTLYVADTFNHVLRTIELATMTVRTIVGRPGVAGVEDGTPTEATLDAPQSLASDGDALYVTSFQGVLRRVALSDLRTSTPLGVFEEVFARDGDRMSARLGVAFGPPLCDRARRMLYVNDRDASSVRRVSLDSYTVSTLAGAQDVGFVRDGAGAVARFDGATEIALSADGARAYVVDSAGRTVRFVDLRANSVQTLAGAAGVSNSVDGAFGATRLGAPSGLALDAAGATLYVSDSRFNTVRALDLRAMQSRTLAGDAGASAGSVDGTGSAARFNGPSRLCLIGSTLYVADSGNRQLRAVDTSTGAVTSVVGSASEAAATVDGPFSTARFRSLSGLACDGANRRVFVADSTANTIRLLDLAASTVQTLTGRDGMSGPADGALNEALFRGPRGLWLNSAASVLYVADQSNHSVRTVDLRARTVATFVGSATRSGGMVHGETTSLRDATLYFPTALAGAADSLFVLADDALHVVRPAGAL